jgi:hypothetical protein
LQNRTWLDACHTHPPHLSNFSKVKICSNAYL